MILITKGNGEQEPFKPEKLSYSLERAGANKETTREIVEKIGRTLSDGMSTSDIYQHAFEILKQKEEEPVAARYSLKRAVMELGPSGFPFEALIAEIFKARGYSTKQDVEIRGRCVPHEVDVVAEKDGELLVTEAKFHNKVGFKTDLKAVLYVRARVEDLMASNYGGLLKDGTRGDFLLITNTKFTRNAKAYARCIGLTLIGWDYPKMNGLEAMIEETGLHPVTCLTTLTDTDRRRLFDANLILCRSIKNDAEQLKRAGVTGKRAERVMQEAMELCRPGVHK